jgi:hypothetical protein
MRGAGTPYSPTESVQPYSRPAQYMSPMPPPGMDGALPLGSDFSVTTASVVSSRPAMELAFCSAVPTK